MHFLCNFLLAVFLHSLLIVANDELKESLNNKQHQEIRANKSLISAGVYAKLFAERRKEQQLVIRRMMALDNYEKNFKLLQIAYGKMFEIMRGKNVTLISRAYEPGRDGFPQDSELQDAVTHTLENCCIAAESLLHFPEISYRILSKHKFSDWKSVLNWCNSFVSSMPHIIDESTVKLMTILMEEINEEQRSSNYVNPYYEEPLVEDTGKTRKQRKKLKKGPSLTGGKTEL